MTFTLLAVALRHAPTAEATVLMSLEIVFSALIGFALLGERLTPLSWTGAALMFCAVLAVQLLRTKPAHG
jgi:drug/metabolite transporter (DMT)-like permease